MAKAISRDELLAILEEARRNNTTVLDLSERGITELPEEIACLTNLQRLSLSFNRLTHLSEAVANFNDLRYLYLENNQLTHLPEAIANLNNLQVLSLSHNQLTHLPEAIANLNNLQHLDLANNQLTELLEAIANLTNLETLYLENNQLTDLPEAIANLNNLQVLSLSHNQLTHLPEAIANLNHLQYLKLPYNQLIHLPKSISYINNLQGLYLDGNPLNLALKTAYDRGLDELKTYLRSLSDSEPLYEAKLVLVGEGGVGKTTLFKALTGKEPRSDEPTTHGIKIDVQSLYLPHPDLEDVEIQLNAWDFGGQEVYRVTHQFFFSRRSLYLLLWEPRKGVQQCQIEDWLNIIRLRVGDEARVIIVSTHCKTGQRIARIDKPILQQKFGKIIVGFHEVDSLVDDETTGEKVGIAELKNIIANTAKDLEQMGMPFSRRWQETRDELLALDVPRIKYNEFESVASRYGLDELATKTLADLMHDLGYIVYYSDDDRLKDDVVLQPEWLTKAIGFVLEDKTTQDMDGILPDDRLKQVWWEYPADGETRFDPKLYPFFLILMEKYDVCYRLEDGTASLVAQHVPQVRPSLPWLPEEEIAPNCRRLAIVCVMEESPPGLVPWTIVRTHDYAYSQRDNDGKEHRLHWQKGMFLRNKKHGEAMLELRDREFYVCVEAVWPQYFTNVIQTTIQKLITDNWPGMKNRYHFAVPCREKPQGKPCAGRFYIDSLKQFHEEGDETIRCQVCRTRQNILELLYGFVEEEPKVQLARIETKLDRGFDEIRDSLREWESRVAKYFFAVLQAIASETKHTPRLFDFEPVDGNWRRMTAKKYRLYLWCEAEGCQHRVCDSDPGKGVYEFDATREWLRRISPYANFIARVLKTVVPMAAPGTDLFFGEGTIDGLDLENHLEMMKQGTAGLLEGEVRFDGGSDRNPLLNHAERSGILALQSLLKDLDPNQANLGLKRMPTYTGEYRWLCHQHYKAAQSKIPERFDFDDD